jgi:hypothetical protein
LNRIIISFAEVPTCNFKVHLLWRGFLSFFLSFFLNLFCLILIIRFLSMSRLKLSLKMVKVFEPDFTQKVLSFITVLLLLPNCMYAMHSSYLLWKSRWKCIDLFSTFFTFSIRQLKSMLSICFQEINKCFRTLMHFQK